MAEAQIKLGYILDPFFQIENTNGKPVVGGHIEVFEAGTDTKYITYQNFDYTQNPFKIPLGSDGRAVVLGDSNLAYDVYIYDSFNNLIVSRLNVAAGDAGGVAGGGLRQVIHDDTMTGRGTQLSPLGVSPLTNLAVDDTMTAYEATVEGKESLVLGVNGDWFNEQFGSAFSGKLDTSSFNSAYYDIKGGLSSKVDWSAMSSYYNKNETYNYFLPRSAIDLTNYYTKEEVYNQNEINTLLDFKQNRLDFGYNENSAISSINGSALVGEGGGEGSCPWISGGKEIAATQTLTDNMIVQVLSSFTLSGNHNHFISVKGGVYRFPNKWEIASGIAETNYFMPQSGMSGYLPISSFNSFIDNGFTPNINALYSSASNLINSANWLIYNKLDVSAFSSWSATYSGNSEVNNYVTNNSSFIDESVNVVQTNSAQWSENTGDTEVNNYVYNNSAINNEVNNVVTSNSGSWNNITGLNGIKNYDLVKLMKYSPTGDTLLGQIRPVDSADNLTFLLHDNLSGVARYGAVELTVTGVPTFDDMTAYQPVSSMTAYQPVGDYAEKSDFTFVQEGWAYDSIPLGGLVSGVSGKGIVANVSLYAKCDTEGDKITASYLKISAASAWSGDIANKVDTSAIESSGAMWNAVYDLVATYSAKWLINGDV